MDERKKTEPETDGIQKSRSMQQSSFKAVKNLLEAQRNIDIIKNRIKVLQLNEGKNLSKIQLQKQQIEKINVAKNQHLQELRKLKINKQQRERIIEQIRDRNQQFRKERQNKIGAAREQLQQTRANIHSNAIELRGINESRILQNKSNCLEKKQQRRDFIFQNEQKSRENILKFYQQKTKSIHTKSQAQIQRMNQSRQKKEKQLTEFEKLEMQMIERHSQSQIAYNEMKSKLDAMLGKIREGKRNDFKQMKSSIHREDGLENTMMQSRYTLQGL